MSTSLIKAGLKLLIRAIPAQQEAHKLLVPSPDEEEQKQLYFQAAPVTFDVVKAALFFPTSPKWPRTTDGKVKIFL